MSAWSSDKKVMGPFSNRLFGFLLDRILILAAQVGGAVLGFLVATFMLSPELSDTDLAESLSVAFFLGWFFWGGVAWFLNYGILQGMSGYTVGKYVFKVRVLRPNGSSPGVIRSMARTLAYFLSALPLGMGFLAYLWNEQGRCWHDSICDTCVVNREKLFPIILALPPPQEPPAMDRAA